MVAFHSNPAEPLPPGPGFPLVCHTRGSQPAFSCRICHPVGVEAQAAATCLHGPHFRARTAQTHPTYRTIGCSYALLGFPLKDAHSRPLLSPLWCVQTIGRVTSWPPSDSTPPWGHSRPPPASTTTHSTQYHRSCPPPNAHSCLPHDRPCTHGVVGTTRCHCTAEQVKQRC